MRRDDSGELCAIRDGALTFDQLLRMADELQLSMRKGAATTRLPLDIDAERVDALLTGTLITQGQ